eukprot:TRINITY_DN1734_c0_g1_i1.p1 TRINITY_DN1734_c0_g1~~TRINITY_DN1734_c0_g1_i1.p1  ORF type:complete len:357 (+),score=111.25 TRINITY_DN1734_c0_g1_i1:213-1283(+)
MQENFGNEFASTIEENEPKESNHLNKRISKACLPCRNSHLSCNNERPCNRCQGRHLECVDAVAKPRGPKKQKSPPLLEESRKRRGSFDENRNFNAEMGYLESQSFFYPHLNGEIIDGSWQASEVNKYYSFDGGWNNMMEESVASVNLFAQELTPSFPFQISSPPLQKTTNQDELGPLDFPEIEAVAGLVSYAESRVGKNANQILWTKIHEKMSKLNQFLNADQKKQLKESVDKDLEELKSTSSKMQIPIIVMGRSARVMYYNDAFKEATGLDLEVPTPIGQYDFLKWIDDRTMLKMQSMIPQLYLSPELKGVNFRLGMNTPKGVVEGAAVITPWRHILGFPHLFVCHFIPFFANED